MRKSTLLIALCTLPAAAFAAGAPSASTSMSSSNMGAPDAGKEISTALDHAQMAVAAGDVKMVQQHLRHVVNCLVGEKSPDFAANEENPCKGMGNGAMNDVDAKSDQHKKLDKALTEAKDGIKKSKAKSAQSEAKDVIKYLQEAQTAKP